MRDALEQALMDEGGLQEFQAREEAGVLWKRYLVRDCALVTAMVAAISLLALLAMSAFGVVFASAPFAVGATFVLVIVFPIIFTGFFGMSRLGRWRAMRRVRWHLKRPACTSCGYILRGLTPLDAQGVRRIACPECGHRSPVAQRSAPSSRPAAHRAMASEIAG